MLTVGRKLGPYEIVSAAGAGGMGEVYRARDTRLGRDVAVKVLPESLSAQPEFQQRFEREARSISALSHPHICALYDVGQDGGTYYLVMEFLEGESLADRLARGPLPCEQVVRYGIEICEALDAAHRQGVVHRDLKPGNVMITRAGAKLLDFGLAKPAEAAVAATSSEVMTAMATNPAKPLTDKGAVLGTFQYMAPEQLEGKPADQRSDIFALGAVLYEMATGRRAFSGKTQASIIAAILAAEPPPVTSVQPLTPPALELLIRTCLAKDPEERYQSVHDVRLQLKQIATASGSVVAPISKRRKLWPALAALAALVAVTLFFVGRRLSEPAPPAPAYRTSLLPPSNHSFVAYDFALSPDGTRLVFSASSPDGVSKLWLKNLATDANTELFGTDGATGPFWSRDSKNIGYFSDNRLNRMDIQTGAVQSLAPAVVGRGGTWSREGQIIFCNAVDKGLSRVPASGGPFVEATKLISQGGESQRFPTFLQDGRHFLFIIDWSNDHDGLYLASMDDPNPKLIQSDVHGTLALVNGRLFFVRDGTLFAQKFDEAKLKLVGDPVAVVAQELEQDTGFSRSGFTVAENGAMVFQSRKSYTSHLVWFDRTGKELETVGPPAPYHPTISPDGNHLAITLDSASDGHMRVHVFDLVRGTITNITPDSTRSEAPVWSPDGNSVAYSSRGPRSELRVRAADGSGDSTKVAESPRIMTTDWSPDGRHILYMNFLKGVPELWTYDAVEKKNAALIPPPAAEGQFSPDGHWIAYTIGGNIEPGIYVQPFPGPGPRTQISVSGGTQSRWSPDGKELYYVGIGKQLMAVSIKTEGGKLVASPPHPLFRTRMHATRYAIFQYDVSHDGKRFLINSLPREDAAAPLTLLTDWQAQTGK
jgi:eukaryotic-like serine/threonine-protein kinase